MPGQRNDDPRNPRVDGGCDCAETDELEKGWMAAAAAVSIMANKDPIRVGVLFSETGATSTIGRSQLHGTLLAIDEINAQGGVLGRPLRLSSKDTASRPAKAEKNVDKLAAEGAVMLFGGFAPFIATLLIQQTGVLSAPAFYVMSAAGLTLVFLLRLKAPDQATALDR